MSDIILQTTGLTKKYAHTAALDHVNVTVQRGRIYGFIGQNGAGKTTFMRLISGLSFPDSGEMRLFGKSGRRELEEQRKRMGCMIDSPALYPYMTAHDNLEAMRLARGIPDREAVWKCLDMAGLDDTGGKRAQNFSMGMRQRLGIASALLGEPEFLMLDEPTNGLDPISISKTRELLKRLAVERQITVFVSSHNLSELYQLATHYIFLHCGRVIQEITKEELDQRCRKHICLQVDDVAGAGVVLERTLKTRNYSVMPDRSVRLYDYVDDINRVITALTQNGLVIRNIGLYGDSLENYFMDIIGGEKND